MNRRTANRIRAVGAVLLLLYFIGLVYFLFLSEAYGRTDINEQLHYNLVPLREIRRFWNNRDYLGTRVVFENLAGNVLGFCPLGALLPVLVKRMRRGPWMVMTGLLASAIVELTQLLLYVGSFDVDDLLLNTLGTAIGFGAFVLCDRLRINYMCRDASDPGRTENQPDQGNKIIRITERK